MKDLVAAMSALARIQTAVQEDRVEYRDMEHQLDFVSRFTEVVKRMGQGEPCTAELQQLGDEIIVRPEGEGDNVRYLAEADRKGPGPRLDTL